MITLYQFPLSHFCEKARWALDYKKLPFKLINLKPLMHVPTIRRIAPKTSVPVIIDGNTIVQDSTAIIDYLEVTYPQNPLEPKIPSEAKQAKDWEEFADKEIGPHLRRYFYFYSLEEPDVVIPLLTKGSGWFGQKIFTLMFPLVRIVMKKTMRINPESAKHSLEVLQKAIERLNEILAKKNYLVGNQFTRADLSVAALLAPLVMPKNHPFPYFTNLPKAVADLKQKCSNQPFYLWVEKMYAQHR